MKPLQSLTSLRFFAALWVVLLHLPRGENVPPAMSRVFDMGYVSVEFFFVLSGFILAYSYLRRSQTVSAREFWIARLARIYPVYGLSLLLAIPELIERSHLWGFGRSGAAVRAASAFTMLQSWYPPAALHYNPPGWSLSVEAFFYLLFPLLLPALVRLPDRRLVPALAGLALIGALLALAGTWVPNSGSAVSPTLNWPKFFPPMHLPAFLFGAVLGRLFLEREPASRRADWEFALLGWGAVVALLAAAFVPGFYLFKHSGGLILVHGALIWALAHGRGRSARVLAWPSFVLLGEASYGLYIIHEPMFYWWNHGVQSLGLSITIEDRVGRIAFIGAVVILAVVIHKTFELPAREWIRARYTHLNPRPVA